MSVAPLVIKIGGSIDDVSRLLEDVAAQRRPLVVVHGAHRVLDDLAVRLGHPPRFVTSTTGATSRFTDATAMDHFLMAYCGLVNKRLVQGLLARGVSAVGLAALDGATVRGRRRADIRVREGARTVVLHGDHAGTITSVDDSLLLTLLANGRTPVICPPALGDDGVPINVDGDRLAAELAVALGAERLVIFSDTTGFLADPDQPDSTIARARLDDLAELAAAARGRARTKLAAVERALLGGVTAVGLCDGRPMRPIEASLAGAGSWFSADAAAVAGVSVATAVLEPMALHAGRGLSLVRGEGATLIDSEGRRYVDLMSNYGVNVLGHAHPEVTAALSRQAATLISAHQSFDTPARDAFLAALAPMVPAELNRACFANSGSEALEVAIKLARVATGRTRIVAMLRGYHGRTMGALSLTADNAYRDAFAPLVPDVVHVAYDDVDALGAAVGSDVAAVVVEPIQGEAGVRPPSAGYLAAVQRLCRSTGSLLVMDEVQTGFRTGAVLACSDEGVVPDILCLGKGIANGLPLAVTLATDDVAAHMPRGGHGSTFAGNPLVCAAGTAALRCLAQPQLHAHVRTSGAAAMERVASLGSPLVREVRGRGLMIGIDLRQPATPLIRRLQERGVLVLPAGRTVIRLLPPLIIDAAEMDTAMDVICEVIAEAA